jgi:hypothetical protein
MPCRNEADNLQVVVQKLKLLQPVAIVVGLDPNTTDNTSEIASALGCIVIPAVKGGYDPAVWVATDYVLRHKLGNKILYTDAGNKYSYDKVPLMESLIAQGNDMVIAVRTDAAKTMLWHQKLGTYIVLASINFATKAKMRDISPFRLVSTAVFNTVHMDPQTYRWPSELLVKAIACGFAIQQVDVVSLPRLGTSKVSGNFMNSLKAGVEMFSSLKFAHYKKEGSHEHKK